MVQVQGRLLPLTATPVVVEPLAVHGLCVRFGDAVAVDGVTLGVSAGEVVGLVGPNGCGKTTTLRAVLGLVTPVTGSVLVGGHAAGTLAARRSVAWLPDEPDGLDELTVGEYLALVGALYGAGERYHRRADGLLRAFTLLDRRRMVLRALSHGTRRIAAFVAAAALDPPLLVVDEATAALDPGASLVLREALLLHARRGRGVLVATQDLAFAAAACERVVLLDRGRVVADGDVDALRATFAADSLEDVFMAALGRRRPTELLGALDAD